MLRLHHAQLAVVLFFHLLPPLDLSVERVILLSLLLVQLSVLFLFVVPQVILQTLYLTVFLESEALNNLLGVLPSLLQLLLKVFDLFLALPVDFALDEDLFNLLDLWLTLRPLRDPHDRQRAVFCTREEKCLLIIEL